MNRKSPSRLPFWLTLAGLLVATAAARFWGVGGTDSRPAPAPAAESQAAAAAAAADSPASAVARQLVAAGWRADAAEEVAALNADFFAVLAEENPRQVRQMTAALARLGRWPAVMDVVRRRPETAGLLAAAPQPDLVADSLRQERSYEAAANIYTRHAADSQAVAEALGRHGTLISQLADEGLLGAETVFLFPRDSQGAAAYDRWLAGAFEAAIDDERQLAALFQLLLIQGDHLRRRMIDDPAFRDEFQNTIWPRLLRLDEQGVVTIELAALDPQLFQLLRQAYGERLARRWGLLPLELLYGENAFPRPLHESLIETMLRGDNVTLLALQRLGREPLLAELLERTDITPQVKATALNKLQAAGSGYPALLRLYSELTAPGALADEVGPPPSGPVTWLPLYYTVYEVPKKIMQGRNPTLMDAVIAVLDPVFLLAGPMGPDDIIKVTGKAAINSTARRSAGKTVANTLTAAARGQASRSLGARAAGQLAARESAPWLISQMLRGTRAAVRNKLQSSLTVDITGPTRFLFKVSGAGRESFRRMTALEARLFMRPDRRVLVRLDRILVGHPAGRFLADTAVAGLVETAAETPTIQHAVGDAARGVEQLPEGAAAVRTRFSAWQKNVSAWWLAEAAGVWDELPEAATEKAASEKEASEKEADEGETSEGEADEAAVEEGGPGEAGTKAATGRRTS